MVRAGAVVLLDVTRDEPAELGRRPVLALEVAETPLYDHVVGPVGALFRPCS